VGRGLDTALPGDVAEALAPAIARFLRAEAALVGRCVAALTAHAVVAREDIAASHDEFAHAFDTLRQTDMVHALDFDSAGRVFGLAFTLERLHRDMADLVDRIDEVATGQPKMHRAPLAAA